MVNIVRILHDRRYEYVVKTKLKIEEDGEDIYKSKFYRFSFFFGREDVSFGDRMPSDRISFAFRANESSDLYKALVDKKVLGDTICLYLSRDFNLVGLDNNINAFTPAVILFDYDEDGKYIRDNFDFETGELPFLMED